MLMFLPLFSIWLSAMLSLNTLNFWPCRKMLLFGWRNIHINCNLNEYQFYEYTAPHAHTLYAEKQQNSWMDVHGWICTPIRALCIRKPFRRIKFSQFSRAGVRLEQFTFFNCILNCNTAGKGRPPKNAGAESATQ